MVFGRNFSEKRQICRYLNPISGKLGVTRPWLMGRWNGKPMVDFLFALIELFLLSIIYYGSGVRPMRRIRLGCFRGGSTSLHSTTILRVRKPETLG